MIAGAHVLQYSPLNCLRRKKKKICSATCRRRQCHGKKSALNKPIGCKVSVHRGRHPIPSDVGRTTRPKGGKKEKEDEEGRRERRAFRNVSGRFSGSSASVRASLSLSRRAQMRTHGSTPSTRPREPPSVLRHRLRQVAAHLTGRHGVLDVTGASRPNRESPSTAGAPPSPVQAAV